MKAACTLTAIFTASIMTNAFNYFPEAFNHASAQQPAAIVLPSQKNTSQKDFKRVLTEAEVMAAGFGGAR